MITNFFWKKEYQACDAPHYHVLLWVENAPVIGKDSDSVVLKWIQKCITCRIPEMNIAILIGIGLLESISFINVVTIVSARLRLVVFSSQDVNLVSLDWKLMMLN